MRQLLSRLLAVAALALPLLAQAAPITLTGTVRDFNSAGTFFNGVAGHPDFEGPCCGSDPGIAATLLGPDGKPVFSGGAHWSVQSAASFYQWYHDDLSVNRTGSTTITLNDIGGGLRQFSSSAYFPIDGQLLGQQACCGHNYGFTTEFHTTFGYAAAHNDTFSFVGDDDVFVFINSRLAIDLGGVHGPMGGTVNLNAIAAGYGLVDGNNYSLDVFQAERHTTGSNFTMTTSLALATTPTGLPEPASLGLVAAGLLAAAAAARRRRA